jgi:hypothetical protein
MIEACDDMSDSERDEQLENREVIDSIDELEVRLNSNTGANYVLEDTLVGERFNLKGPNDMRNIAKVLMRAANTLDSDE